MVLSDVMVIFCFVRAVTLETSDAAFDNERLH